MFEAYFQLARREKPQLVYGEKLAVTGTICSGGDLVDVPVYELSEGPFFQTNIENVQRIGRTGQVLPALFGDKTGAEAIELFDACGPHFLSQTKISDL